MTFRVSKYTHNAWKAPQQHKNRQIQLNAPRQFAYKQAWQPILPQSSAYKCKHGRLFERRDFSKHWRIYKLVHKAVDK